MKKEFSAKEISNFYDTKLIFVLSDMFSASWKSGDAFEVFSKLYESIPTFVVQMLPHRLWRTTVLGSFSVTSLSTDKRYATKNDFNSQLDYILESLKENKNDRYKLPIVNFELSYLRVISNTLQAKDGNSIDGAIIDFKSLDEKFGIQEKLTSNEQVDIFFTNASFQAQELMKAFSSVPLNLAIMRMIQEKVIDESSNIYLAEVLNSKLLVKKGDFYEFVDDEVFSQVFKLFGRKQALEIAYNNSDYIQENLNARFGFKALLAGEIDLEDIDFEKNSEKVFASVSCKVLKHLGAEYAKKVGCQGKKRIKAITPTTKRYQMGSNERKEEQPIHEIIINYDFEMSPTQVTVGEFKVFVEETDYVTEAEKGDGTYVYTPKFEKKEDASWKNPYFEQTDEHPVVCVSWNDAQAYINWLNKKTNEVYRLPTEAEWEYACRAESTTKWHFGDDEKELEEYAWYDDKGGKSTKAVGTKKPNKWGLHDMYGNVWEWCLDDYVDNYNDTPRDGSENKKGEEGTKVLRGGSWYDSANFTRSADRSGNGPTDRNGYVGFRLLRTLP